MLYLILFSAQAVAPETPIEPVSDEILVTAARSAEEKAETAASASVIDRDGIERLGAPLLDSIVRLTPSAAVAASGPAGSFSEVRIRGAEANHTLLFIDGIRANDPAANNTPRFELLNADLASRLEVVRGPQSALWGSEAIGGVIALNGLDEPAGYRVGAEAGSFGFARASATGSLRSGAALLSGAVGWQRAEGIDSFDGEGDKDGYRNLSGRVRGQLDLTPEVELGLTGFLLAGRSEFDGLDLSTFIHADTLDSNRNRLAAGRLWARFGGSDAGLGGTVSASLLGSSNRNLLGEEEINRTRGRRWSGNGQLEYRFGTGAIAHTAIIALDLGREAFRSRDLLYGGASNQDRERTQAAATAEWRSALAGAVLDVALRHDRFSDFNDATTIRASLLARIGNGMSIAGSYGEGIAQPTFFDLYGFFPGSFVGNESLKPESSRGFEASLRYRHGWLGAALTGYRQVLRDEIVDMFDPVTFLSTTANRQQNSRRSGVEAEVDWTPSKAIRLAANYAYLRASEPAGALQLRETRRPAHSGSVMIDGAAGRFSYGVSLAYAGARDDMNFDVFPARRERLGSYWLAGARAAYRVRGGVELFARASNLFDEAYQEVFGYRTEGRGLYVGVQLADR